jgi:Hemolysins and related proteins containing CBS domains
MAYGVDILIIFLLLLLNGFFAMSELAVVSSRKPRLKNLADQGHRGAQVALELAENPGRFLSTVQVGITLIGIFAGVFGGEELAPPLQSYFAGFSLLAPFSEALGIITVVIGVTYASLIVGELVPKQLALKNPERVASVVAPSMAVLAIFASPVVYLLETSARFFLVLVGAGTARQPTVTEEEVKAIITEGVEEGVLLPAEKDMIKGVMRLADWRVRAIMTPRPDIVWIDLEDGEQEIRHKLKETSYSRLPVARGDLDKLLGIIQAKDLLNRAIDGQSLDIKSVLCQPLFVHANMLALQVLEMLKKSPIHMTVVVDEYGSVEGIVTPTDILKAIVGGLTEPGMSYEPEVVQREDGSWLIDGNLHIDVMKDLLSLREIPEEGDFHTVAGFMLSQFEKVPTAGDHFKWEGLRFEVVDMDGQRIDKILVVPTPASSSISVPTDSE